MSRDVVPSASMCLINFLILFERVVSGSRSFIGCLPGIDLFLAKIMINRASESQTHCLSSE